ncbi:MAG: 50S ribosomal protein L22 [Candidatus Levybacteria bacterium]|nr:50S ribosomal protein L22 [Candidatus Levybacteria bacterium]
MEYIAVAKGVRIAPRKVGLVADAFRRKQSVDAWLDSLILVRKRGGDAIEKTLKSALANAINKGAKKENLIVKSIEISPGPAFKRYHPSTRGRIHPYKKRTSHIRIVLMDDKVQISNSKSQIKKETELKKTNEKQEAKGEKDGSKS